MDGDGLADILIGSDNEDWFSAGKAYLILGSLYQVKCNTDLSQRDYTFTGEASIQAMENLACLQDWMMVWMMY